MQHLCGAQSLFLFARFLWRYKLLSNAESRTKDIGEVVCIRNGKQNRSICSFECGYGDNHSGINLFDKMKVICVGGNSNCENYVHEKEFDIDEEDFDNDNARCPECGGNVAPVWIKKYSLPGEEKLQAEIKEIYDKKDRLGEKINSDNKEKDKKRIISALESKPLLTEELLEALGYEPGGGELVFPIRELMEEGKIMREKVQLRIWWGLVPGLDTFSYSLKKEVKDVIRTKHD